MTRAGDKLYRDPELPQPEQGRAALSWLAIVILLYATVRIVLTRLV